MIMLCPGGVQLSPSPVSVHSAPHTRGCTCDGATACAVADVTVHVAPFQLAGGCHASGGHRVGIGVRLSLYGERGQDGSAGLADADTPQQPMSQLTRCGLLRGGRCRAAPFAPLAETLAGTAACKDTADQLMRRRQRPCALGAPHDRALAPGDVPPTRHI
eukprot:362969-Chlamydomonas_euryale.AAC.6